VKWGWLLGALALAAFLVARRRQLGRWTQLAGWIAAAAAGAVGIGVIPLPNLEELMLDLGRALGPWTYLVVGILAFLETGAFVGLIAPGETTVIVGGVIAGQGEISLSVLIAITWVCAVAGDLASYTAGRKLGRAWLLRHGERVKITEERLHQVEEFFEKRGGVTILIGRFIGFVRALAPFIAGTSRMPLRRFLPYDVLGAGAWSATFATLGYVFWHSFDRLTTYVSRGLFAFGTVVAVVAAFVALVRLRRDPALRAKVRAWLDERRDKPGWRPVVKLARPAWRLIGRPAAGGADLAARFSAGRLTPGGLGLELTTLLALLAVGTYSFLFIGHLVSQPGLPGIDEMAADLATDLAMDPLIEIAKVVTELGSLPVVALAALATAIWALTQRRHLDAGALVVGVWLSFVVVNVTKAAYDRVRPEDALVGFSDASYPSGHTAYAVTLVACAAVLVRAGSGWAARFAAVTVAAGLVVVVGLTRVYLHVHHLTDVLGGAALGAALWALVGTLALVVGYLRHNGAETDDR
jgi:membrane protein DedA with SNARE-associated domain/membrane-associated phospholipid phosphatase